MDLQNSLSKSSFLHPELAQAPWHLTVDTFSLWYGSVRALQGIELGLVARTVTAFIGPSGCGKSTLLRSFNRLNDLIDGTRTEGNILLGKEAVYAPQVDVTLLRKRIGMVFQRSIPFPMSIFDNVAYPLRIAGMRDRSAIEERVERSLRQAALWGDVKDRLRRSALDMSGGQQQRLSIARAIAAEPEVLLMDEPCSALDPLSTAKIEELIRELGETLTVVIVTHSMSQAKRVSEYTAFFYMGSLVEAGPTQTLFHSAALRQTQDYIQGRFG